MITELQIEIETKCGLNCIHCSSSNMRNTNRLEYHINDLLELKQYLRHPLHISLTGGEPLLNSNIESIISKLKSNNVESTTVGLYTSGILYENGKYRSISEPLAEKLRSSGLNECSISLYHYIPAYHDKITNTANSFNLTIESIKNLISIGISVKIHLVLTKLNIDEIENTINFISSLGVSEVRILRLAFVGAAVNSWSIIGVDISTQNNRIRELYNNRSKYNVPITIAGFPSLTACRPYESSVKCQAGISLFYITAAGDIYPCACAKNDIEKKIGNIKLLDNKVINKINKNNILYYESCINQS